MRSAFDKGVRLAIRVLRVAAYLTVVCTALGIVAARSVYGAVKDAALGVGSELVALGDVVGPASHVRINGEEVNVASAMTDVAVSDVLDRFEAMCRSNSGGWVEELARLPEGVKAKVDGIGGDAKFGVIRRQSREGEGERGMVACLARTSTSGGAGIARGVADFVRTGDLSSVGRLRYVVAERGARSGARTHVVTAWTDGAFRVGSMFPREGDAPGSDAADAPRPESSKRLLTASVENAPYSVRIYDVAGTPADVIAQYERAMPAAGWAPIPGVARELKDGLAYSRDSVDWMAFTQADGERTIVSIVEMPPRGGRSE